MMTRSVMASASHRQFFYTQPGAIPNENVEAGATRRPPDVTLGGIVPGTTQSNAQRLVKKTLLYFKILIFSFVLASFV